MHLDPANSKRHQFSILGVVLALGAPLGLLFVRGWFTGELELEWVRRELASRTVTYAYVWLSTSIAFYFYGYWAGAHADRLSSASFTDPLTGLWNRRYLHRRTITEARRAYRHHASLAFLLVDVDELKAINDEGGHEQGDRALSLVARALSDAARSTDVIARWGGDEFAILSPHTQAPQAVKLAERIHHHLKALSGNERPITVSIGIADTLRSAEPDEQALLSAADVALYHAKRLGRNRTELAPRTIPPVAPPLTEANPR